MKKAVLPELPYSYDALEPVISKEIMEIHHKKHHQAYVNNYNAALEKLEKTNEPAEIVALQGAIKFNGGGHVNHSLFWENLAPDSAPPSGPLADAINTKWGSLEKFIDTFNAQVAPLQGSGWGWLGLKNGELSIINCPNQDPLNLTGYAPLLGIDVWEHAYYLQYKNVRPDYLKAIWKVVNWKVVEERYERALNS